MNLRNLFSVSVVLLLLCSCEYARQADRAVYNMANKISSRDLVTGQRRLSFADRQQQIEQGNQTALKVIEQYQQSGKKLNEQLNANQYNRLVNIVKNIVSVSHLKNENWQVVMLPEKDFNAFVTGGTIIFVNYGLMEVSPFDDEVAAVVGHEIAHSAAGHVSERQASQMALSLAGGKSVRSSVMQAAFSQNDELEADKVGILYMTLAGYDPEASERIWQKMYNKSGNNGQMITSHPVSSDRMLKNRETIEKVKKYYIPGQKNPNFEYILRNNDVTVGTGIGKALAAFSNDSYAGQPDMQQYEQSGYQQQDPMQQGPGLQPGSGAGLMALAETAANLYGSKQAAQAQAAHEVSRVETLKQIQNNMQIVGGKKNSDGSFSMNIKYNGQQAVQYLAIKAVTPETESLYRHNEVIVPGQSFNATFGPELLQNVGDHPKMKLLVDEGSYLN